MMLPERIRPMPPCPHRRYALTRLVEGIPRASRFLGSHEGNALCHGTLEEPVRGSLAAELEFQRLAQRRSIDIVGFVALCL
jgi:hypothetical protein